MRVSWLLIVFVHVVNQCLADEVTITVDVEVAKQIEPGAVGWGAMWKREMLYPSPGAIESDADHEAYIERLAREGLALAQAADLRNISWPWGVSFSTWGVNWENSIKAWSLRPKDCARIFLLNKGSGWCERTIVGIGDLMYLADQWGLEALTVAVPLSVLDGSHVRWGPNFVTHVIDGPTVEKISNHAVDLINYMRSRPQWDSLSRIYLAAGCEWRHYGQPRAVDSYAKLIKRIRAKIPDEKVIVVASASDSADIPGFAEALKTRSWNQPLYDALHQVRGVALDLHRYRGMRFTTSAPDGSTAPTIENVLELARTGVTQRDFFAVKPSQWDGNDPRPAMASVLLENAIHGKMGDHSTHSSEPWPWPAVMAHADLVREALSSSAMTFLGWTWFPEDLPQEWPHGAILPSGRLSQHAQAQAFLSRYHRGVVLKSSISHDNGVRGAAVRHEDGKLCLYGGNFSMDPHKLKIAGVPLKPGTVEYMTDTQNHRIAWDMTTPLPLPPMTLWRISF